MELQQLKYFCEVTKREHVTRTAEKLFVSQSAISRAVTQLEGELGVPLFYRQGRAVVLSPYGRLFLEHVTQALSILENGKRLLSEQTGEESGCVSLGFLHSLGIEMVPRLIKEYRRKHPRIQFTLLVQRSGEMLMKELVAGSIDLCLSVPGMFGQNDVRWSHLLDEELLIALPQTHRLAARRTLNMRELSSEPFLALSPEHTLRIIFDKVCADASFLPKIAFEGMDIATLRGLIGAGLGIGLFPPAPARLAGVVEIKLSPARPIRPLGIGWFDHRYLPASAIEFRKFVVSKFHGE
ncbi:MAG TPA: LysR family transcriptional regulator [Candidatus Acidoferrum sp.]|nr:LysR family transcriptional regulator [Candidatus Acidoferrum sp.]